MGVDVVHFMNHQESLFKSQGHYSDTIDTQLHGKVEIGHEPSGSEPSDTT